MVRLNNNISQFDFKTTTEEKKKLSVVVKHSRETIDLYSKAFKSIQLIDFANRDKNYGMA